MIFTFATCADLKDALRPTERQGLKSHLERAREMLTSDPVIRQQIDGREWRLA